MGESGRFGDGPIMAGRPFGRQEARAAGLGRDCLTRLVETGLVRHVVRGVYVDARVPDDVGVRAACLALKLPADAVACRRTAAWLLGIDGRAPDELGLPLPVECMVPSGRQPVRRPGVVGLSAPPDVELAVVQGVPCTTAVRTALDVLRWCRPHLALGIVDALAARDLVGPAELQLSIAELTGTRGVRQARYLAGLVEPLTQSMGESWVRLRMADAGFPRPQAQIPVRADDGLLLALLDLGWGRERVAVEYDGEEFHSSPEQVAHDRRRREMLERDHGWRILAVRKGEVLGRSLEMEWAVGELLGREPTITRRLW
jgi:hypothetical protein